MLPKNWKKSFSSGIKFILLFKKKRSKKCNFEIICHECNILVNENKHFEANLNLLKRKPCAYFGHMLPYYQE